MARSRPASICAGPETGCCVAATMTMTPFKQVLAADATLAEWEARRRVEHALTIVVRRNLPRPLAPRIHVVDARGRELELAADAGAVAAMLRQRSADLLAS